MALGTPTGLTQGISSATTTSYTSASITPVVGQTVIIVVCNASGADNVAIPTSIASSNITWNSTPNATQAYQGAAGTNRRIISVWKGVATSASSAAITITFGVSNVRCLWQVFQFGTDVATSGTIIQAAGNNTGSNVSTYSVSLGAFTSSTSGTLAVFVTGNADTSFSPKAGWTEIYDENAAGNSLSLETQFIGTNDLTATAVPSGSVSMGGIIMEIKAASLAKTPISLLFNGLNGGLETP